MPSKSNKPQEPPRGGAATAHGVLYQMLWTVFQAQKQAASCEVLNAEVDETGGDLKHATFIVEPPSGGDLIRGRTVDQIKSRSSGRSWSFEDVLTEVLTDLYRAAMTDMDFSGYRFVTEKKPVSWERVLEFFEDLSGRPEPPDGLATLDDREPLVGRSVLRKISGPSTQRNIFDHVVEVIRHEVPDAVGESLEATQLRVWRMLSRFKIEPLAWEDLEAEIRREIIWRGCSDNLIDRTRQALVGGLLDVAATSTWKNPGRVDPAAFLKEHGLDGLRVCDRKALLARSRDYLDRCLKGFRYDKGSDVRREPAGLHFWQREEVEGTQEPVITDRPVIIFTGESGQGWALFRLADELAKAGELVLLFRARGSVESDYETAASLFCREIWGHGHELSLSRLTRRLRDAIPEVRQSRITLLIHGVASETYADDLIRYPWEDLGIRVAASFRGNSQWQPAAADRCHLVPVGFFQDEEIALLLEGAKGPDWVLVPSDVRKILKHPLLVQLYLEGTATRHAWTPTQEYELFEAHWTRHLDSAPLEVDLIAELASLLPEEKLYPWPLSRLRDIGLQSGGLLVLEQSGLLSRSLGGRYFEISLDRILNWAVAEGLVARLRSGRLAAREVPEKALACRASATETGGRWLGYVPLDLFWLLADPAQRQQEAIEAFLDALEARFDHLGVLQGLSSLGPRIVPYLIDRLRRHAVERRSLRFRYRDLLLETDDDSIPERVLKLLEPIHVSQSLQQVAAEILARKPTAAALDRLWELRCEAEGEDTDEASPGNRIWLRQELEGALRTCVRTARDWLQATIHRSDPSREPFAALVYLLPWAEGGRDLWFGVKEIVFSKIPASDERAAVVCIEAFRDEGELPWLRARFRHPDGMVAAMALQAYNLIRPGEPPPEELDSEALDRLAFTRSWWLQPYLLDDPESMANLVLRRMRESEEPWDVADVYRSRENEITTEILRLLLEQTGRLLRREIESPSPDDREPLWRHVLFLARIARRDLLDVFFELQGSAFENDLATLLERRGAGEGRAGRPFEDRALKILEKIGGNGLTRISNFYLARGQSRWAREDGLTRAVRRSNKETVRLLPRLARGEVDPADRETDFPWEQVKAVEVLADLGKWRQVIEGVVRLGLRFSYEFAQRFPSRALTNAELKPALAALEGGEPHSPGAILALGYSRRHDLVPRLHILLRQAERESDTAQACLLALEALADTSAETEEVFLEHLRVPRNRYVAWRALLTTIRTPQAYQALLGLFRELREADYGLAQLTAINLLEIDETRKPMASLLWQEFGQEIDRWHLIDYAGAALEQLACLETEDVRSFLLQVALGDDRYPGESEARLSAIDGVAQFNPQRAFDAARRLMLSQSSLREEYPKRLLQYDAEGALVVFEEILRKSDDFLLIAAIGEAVDRAGVVSKAIDWLGSPSPALRRGACFTSESIRWTEDLDKALTTCIRDEDWAVREAAKGLRGDSEEPRG